MLQSLFKKMRMYLCECMLIFLFFLFKCLRMQAILSIGSVIPECLHCRFWILILILRSCAQFLFQINLNVYACLVCSTYYQVRGQKSYSLEAGNHDHTTQVFDQRKFLDDVWHIML